MSKKSFEAGLEAGAKPFEEKFSKQATAFEKTADRLDEKLDSIKDGVDVLMDDALARERKEIYGINTVYDIKSMDNTERILTVSLLYALAKRFEANEYQKKYIRSVQQYLNLKNIQPSETLTGADSVKNIDDQKAILQVVMEYLFLECFSFDFLDDENYEELFDSFNINRRGFREVESAIENIYQAVGAEGLAEKYGELSEEPDESIEENATINSLPVEELDALEKEAEDLFFNFKIKESLEIFDQLTGYNYPRAMYFASEIYSNEGFGVITVDEEKASLLRERGYKLGDALSSVRYADMLKDVCEYGTIIQQISQKIQQEANSGNVFAQYELARIFEKGIGCEKNIDAAFMWLNKCSDFWRSKFSLGHYYLQGIAIKKDAQKAAELWKEVADMGYMHSAHNYYLALEIASKLTTDVLDYLVKAVDAGCRLSFYLLAEVYYHGSKPGIAIKKDKDKAKELLQASADLGYKDAIIKLNLLTSGKKISILSWKSPYYV